MATNTTISDMVEQLTSTKISPPLPKKSDQSPSKRLTDLPNESQERIFKEVVPKGGDELNFLAVESSGSQPQRLIDCSPEWNLPWVSHLRLICHSIERIVTPIIYSCVQVRISREAVLPWKPEFRLAKQQEPLLLRNVIPSRIADRVEEICVIDRTALIHMYPMAPIDVSGLTKLKDLIFHDFDPASALNFGDITVKRLTDDETFERAVAMCKPQARRGTDAAEKIERAYATVRRLGAVRAARNAQLTIMRGSFDDPSSYRRMCSFMANEYLKIGRDYIRGLLPSTNIVIEAIDNVGLSMTAQLIIPATGTPTAELWAQPIQQHKQSWMLNFANLNGYGAPWIEAEFPNFV